MRVIPATHRAATPARPPCCAAAAAVKIHRGFKEALTIKTAFAAEAIYGGQLLGVRAQDFVVFYDWNTGRVSEGVGCECGVGKVGRGGCVGWGVLKRCAYVLQPGQVEGGGRGRR